MGGPHAGVFMIRIEEKPDLLVDLPVGTLQAIAQQGFFCIVVVLVTGAAGGAHIPEVAGAILARNGCKHFGGFRCTANRGHEEQHLAGFHGLQAHQPVERGVGELPQHVVVAALGRSLRSAVANQQGFHPLPDCHRLRGEAH